MTTWTRTVVPNCYIGKDYFSQAVGSLAAGTTTVDSNNDVVKIPLFDNFVTAHEYTRTSNVKSVFTVQTGDVIVLSACTKEIGSTDVIEDLIKEQGSNCIKVKSVAVNTNGAFPIKHIKAVG